MQTAKNSCFKNHSNWSDKCKYVTSGCLKPWQLIIRVAYAIRFLRVRKIVPFKNFSLKKSRRDRQKLKRNWVTGINAVERDIPGASTIPKGSPGRLRSLTVASSKLWFKLSCRLPPECLPESSDNVGERDLNSEKNNVICKLESRDWFRFKSLLDSLRFMCKQKSNLDDFCFCVYPHLLGKFPATKCLYAAKLNLIASKFYPRRTNLTWKFLFQTEMLYLEDFHRKTTYINLLHHKNLHNVLTKQCRSTWFVKNSVDRGHLFWMLYTACLAITSENCLLWHQ